MHRVRNALTRRKGVGVFGSVLLRCEGEERLKVHWVGNVLTRRKGVGVFGSALLRCEGVRGFGFGIGCSGVIQMTRDGHRQVGIGRIGVGMVTVMT